MFTTIRELKPYNVNLESQTFWAPATAAHSAHGKQKKIQPVSVPPPAVKLQEDSSSDVKIDLYRLPAVSGYQSDNLRTVPSIAAFTNTEGNENAKSSRHNTQEVESSLLLVDAVTPSLVKPPLDDTWSFEITVQRGLESPSMMFESVDEPGEPGWIDLPTVNQAAEEAAISTDLSISTSNSLAKHLSIPLPSPSASALPRADKASQSIMESSILSDNCLPTFSTPTLFDSISATPGACSSMQQSLGTSAKQVIDANGDEPYCVGSEPSQSTTKPLQRTEDSHIPSSPNHSDYGHSSAAYDGDDGSKAHNDAMGCKTSGGEEEAAVYDSEQLPRKRRMIPQSLATNTPSCAISNTEYCETSRSEDDAADYDSEQPPRKRPKVGQSLATNSSSHGCDNTPRFPASTELIKQMGKFIPSSDMLSLASSLAQDSSNNGDTGASDAIIYEEVTFSGRLRFSSVDGTKIFQMQWEFPQNTDASQESNSTHASQESNSTHASQESNSTHAVDTEKSQESSIAHPSGAEGSQESRITRRAFSITPTRPTSKNTRHTPRIPFSREEEDLLISLKERQKKISWKDIHEKFSKEFPGRSCASLQVRYCTKLRNRLMQGIL